VTLDFHKVLSLQRVRAFGGNVLGIGSALPTPSSLLMRRLDCARLSTLFRAQPLRLLFIDFRQ